MGVISKLTKKDRRQVVADYVMMRSFRKVAEKYGISHVAVANIVRQNQELYDELTLLENKIVVEDLKERLEQRKGVVAAIMDICLFTLADPERLCEAPVNQVVQVFSTLYDKFVDNKLSVNVESSGVVFLPQQTEIKYDEAEEENAGIKNEDGAKEDEK